MIDIRVHIANEVEIFDENVFVDIQLPQVPAIGSILHLTNKLQLELENKCLNSETKKDYYPDYFYGKDNRLSFSDCVEVIYVKYDANNTMVTIVLGMV